MEEHFRRLERMYLAAPANEYFKPRIAIADGEAEVRLLVRPDFFHAAGAVHGAVYFKLLDDATFFAVASRVTDVFVLTARFELSFRRPVLGGEMIARGRVLRNEEKRIIAEGRLESADGVLLGEGHGEFARSVVPLSPDMGYR